MPNAYTHLMDSNLNTAGVSEVVLLAPVSVFTTIAAFDPAQAASSGSDVVITANHVFQANQGFVKVLTAPNKNILNFPSVGEPGNIKANANFEMHIPGTDAKIREFVKNYQNKPFIMLIKDSNQSQTVPTWYQLGDPDVFCWLQSYEGGTGTTGGGVKGIKLTWGYAAETVWDYRGTLTYKP